MHNNFYIVIMAGGSGTRLWPISRQATPKQFHKFSSGDRSLLQETYDRVSDIVPKENIMVSLAASNVKSSREQLPEIPVENFIIEPEGKNTAPAFGLIAAKLFKLDPDAVVATIASDHTVRRVEEFKKSIKQALNFVAGMPNYVVTIGITPTDPNTNYGYIKVGRKLDNEPVHEVERFEEKPELEKAQNYLKSGDYLWNASYFIWQATQMLQNFAEHQPEIYTGLKEILRAIGTAEEKSLIEKIYATFPNKPIEPAIIEKIKDVGVIPSDLGWSDIGTFASLYEFLADKTGANNVEKGHHIGIRNKNCLIYAQDKLLATVGLENIIIVDTPDVTLVCNKNDATGIKELLTELKEKGKEKYL